jgi:hypothetical protein
LEGGPPRFRPRFTRAVLLRNVRQQVAEFRLRDGCPLWFAVPRDSTTTQLCNCCRPNHRPERTPYNTPSATRDCLHGQGLGWIPFRSPLLRESLLISFPRGTEMFHFPRLSLPGLCVQPGVTPFWSAGFTHSGISGSKAVQRLTGAFRSRPRPSSTLGA